MTTSLPWQNLQQRLLEINDLQSAAALLHWDQATYMPPGGAAARGRQLATLQRLAHDRLTDPALGDLLERTWDWPQGSDEAALVRLARRHYQRARRLPNAFIGELVSHQAHTYAAWAQARAEDDFALVQPYLEKTLRLSRDLASFFPEAEHPLDALIEEEDPGYSCRDLKALFSELRQHLVPLLAEITATPPPDDACLTQYFPAAEQLAFSRRLVARLGYDLERGRQDQTLHPFMTKFSLGDVRITTRVREDNLGEALFSSIHEMGHALYEQGIAPHLEGTPLAEGTSSGMHESQSRFWENLIGRSLPFWEWCYPQLQAVFPTQLGSVSLEEFYRAVNKVRRSLIRTDADEVSYNLHVMIRFNLELALVEGSLEVKDLPAAWNHYYQTDLGLTPPTDREGILQDVHWYGGQIGGMFQGYTLGNLISAQLYEALQADQPDLGSRVRRGEFAPISTWLRTHVHQHGAKYTPQELLQRATGSPLRVEPFVNYLRRKYEEIYS